MRARRLIKMVTLSLTLPFAPLAIEAQPAGIVPRIGLLDLGSLRSSGGQPWDFVTLVA